jgi:hypothetical protein
MRSRRSVAFLLTIALAILCAGDLLASRSRGCGPHPCCIKGACKMMPKSGARFDRCPDDQRSASVPLIVLAAVDSLIVDILAAPAPVAIIDPSSDGTSRNVDRPPRA